MLAILKQNKLFMTEICCLPLKQRLDNHFFARELFGGNLNITWDGKSVVLSELVTLKFHCSEVQAAKPLL